MADCTDSAKNPDSKFRVDVDCCIIEKQFPVIGKCCDRNNATAGIEYHNICPCCEIWTSLPEGANLDVATIFECRRYGYDKRIKER